MGGSWSGPPTFYSTAWWLDGVKYVAGVSTRPSPPNVTGKATLVAQYLGEVAGCWI